MRGGERRRATKAPFAAAADVCAGDREEGNIYNTAHTEGEGERGPFLTSSIYLSSDLPKREGARKKKDERACVTHS